MSLHLAESLPGTGRASKDLRRQLVTAMARRLAGNARRCWQAYWDRQTRRATVRLLEALDDRSLDDIGLSRGAIRTAVLGTGAWWHTYELHWRRPFER